MQTFVRTSGQTTILDMEGKLIRGVEGQIFELFKELLTKGQKYVLLNLAEVPVIDSIGIGVLIKVYKDVNAAGGKLKVLNPSPLARQLLSMTSLHSVFETFEDETTALASFN